jgi:hypothetical protein
MAQEQLNPPALIGEAVAGRPFQVRKALARLSTGLNTSTLDMAELLYEAQSNNYFSLWGYPSLSKFAEKELGLKYRRAQYLARIVKVYRAVGLTRTSCENVPVSKLRAITTLDPDSSFWNTETKLSEPLDEHIVRLITEANEQTLKQIEAEVAKLKGQTGPNRRITRSYNVDESTYLNVIKPALEIIRRKLGSAGRDDSGNAVEYSDGVCFEMICAEVLADPNNQEPEELPGETEGLVAEQVIPEDNTLDSKIALPQEIEI